MKVVEDVEECILSALTHKILDVIHNEHIHLHIECKEVSKLVSHIHRIHILSLESVRRNIKHYEFWVLLLDLDTDRLCKVGLSKTWTAKEEERVECCLTRSLRDALTCCESHLVTLTYDEVLEAIYRIQLWVYLHSLHSREYEWTRITATSESLDRDCLVYRSIAVGSRIDQRLLTLYRCHHIHKLGCYSELLFE